MAQIMQSVLSVAALVAAAQFAVFLSVLAWFIAGSLKERRQQRRTASHER